MTLQEGDALWALGAVVVVLQGRRLAARAVDQVAHRVERALQGQILDPLHLLLTHQRSQQLQDAWQVQSPSEADELFAITLGSRLLTHTHGWHSSQPVPSACSPTSQLLWEGQC